MFTAKLTVDKDSLWTVLPPDKPVVFWDSCSFLDCLRIVVRYNKQYFDNYQYILSLITNGDVISIIPEIVLGEIKGNWDLVYSISESFQERTRENAKKIKLIHDNDEEAANNIYSTLLNANVLEKTKNIVIRIIKNSYALKDNQQFQDFAHFRLLNKIAPAHKKNEYKDCYIWGSAVICADMRPDKSHPVYFISSNTSDYSCKDSKRNLDDQIKNDCDKTSIDFARNINELRGLINRFQKTSSAN